MKKWINKQTIVMFIFGIVISSTSFVVATNIVTNPNPFPVIKDGKEVVVDGYNINGSTYLKLRDVAGLVDTNVEFKDKKIYVGNNIIKEDYTEIKYLDQFSGVQYNNQIYLSTSPELQNNLWIKKYKLIYDETKKLNLIDENNNILITIDLLNSNQSIIFKGKNYINYELIKNYITV
jgi:hypothetical protein